MTNRRPILFLAIAIGVLGGIFLLAGPAERPTARPLLVASIYPLADIVRNVAGDGFEVLCLLPPSASPHTFEPTAKQLEALSKSRIFFRIGLDLEFWAEKLIEAASPKPKVVTVSEGIEPLRFESSEHEEEDEHEHRHRHSEGDHHHGIYDPHIWLDPVLALTIVENVVKALSAADPQGSSGYAARGAAYSEKLRQLDGEFRKQLVGRSVKFVAFHNAYAYLAKRYGLEVIGLVEESPGKEPGARHIASLIDGLRKRGAGAVAVEPQFNPRTAEAIAREAGVQVLMLDPMGDPSDPRRSTYLGLMRFNLEQLLKIASGGAR